MQCLPHGNAGVNEVRSCFFHWNGFFFWKINHWIKVKYIRMRLRLLVLNLRTHENCMKTALKIWPVVFFYIFSPPFSTKLLEDQKELQNLPRECGCRWGTWLPPMGVELQLLDEIRCMTSRSVMIAEGADNCSNVSGDLDLFWWGSWRQKLSLTKTVVASEPIKAELDRRLKLLKPKQAAHELSTPQEFFAISAEEIRREQ